MNIEEVINNLKKYISFSEKECNFPSTFDWNWHMELANDIETLLTAYEKEKEENMSYYYHIQGLEDDIRMHYISTYKIEKEIKKIKDSNTYGYVGEEWNDRDVVELLENLISKEE